LIHFYKRLCNLATLKRSRKERESEEDGWAGRREAAVEREAGPRRERVPAAGLGDMSSDTGEEGSHCNRDSEPESPDRLPEQSLEDLARAAVIASSSDDNARVTSDDSDEQNESPLKLKEKSERKRKKSNSSEGETRPKSKKLSLLSMKLSESDSSEDEKKYRARMEKRSARVSAGAATKHGGDSSDSSDIAAQTSGKKKKQQRRRKILVESGHEESSEDQSPSEDDMPEEATKKKPLPKKKKKSSSSDEESDSESDETLKKRKRGKDGSDSGENKEDESPTKRHNIKKLIKDKNLAEETKTAAAEERERRKRVEERKVSYNNTFGDTSGLPQDKDAILDKLVLDFDPETKKILVEVNRKLVKKLKPHQANGIKFMWESVFESVSQIKAGKMPGGAILAHCMGLGKTLQSVSLAHTVMTQRKVALERVMVICPVNVVKNWQDEFHKWLPGDLALDVTEMSAEKDNWGRADRIDYWYKEGGVLLIGYDMFRNLTKENNTKFKKKQKEVFHRCLLDPGPQLVICDEGHLLKNEKSAINKAVNRIKTPRRIILTGTPLQNNLKEYYEMVNFVKPNLMGTRKEFMNRFVNPIVNGQHSDSTDRDVNTMKKRSFILNDLIKGCMQRLDYNVLVPYLMPKQEYVIMIQLTDFQKKLYRFYLENYAKAGQIGSDGKLEGGKKGGLFYDVQNLSRVWNHPYILKLSKQRKEAKEGIASDDDDDDLKDFINDEDAIYDDEDSDIQEVDEDGYGVPKTRPGKPLDVDTNTEVVSGSSAWWNQFLDDDQLLDDITLGSKMVLLMDILKECALIGDKVLVFSQSILSLNLIEDFLGKVNDAHESAVGKESAMADYLDTWIPGKDYYRMDGSTPAETRKLWCKFFNRATSHRMRLFLISTKAGGLGINLVAANRVIIFDASWNPSHDVQSIFRVFRFGQTKPVYVYRFLAKGTMEEKIYDRQVTKQSLAARVVDEQQIESHFTMNELAELYEFNDEPMSARPTPVVPEDRLLAEVVDKHKVAVWNIHKHDSLLENKVDENLTEEERKAAWDEYEQEKTGLIQTNVGMENLQQFGMMLQTMLPKSGDGRIMASPINPMAIQAQLRQMNPELSHEELVTRTRAAIMQLQNMHRTQTPVMVNKNTLNVGQRQTTGYDQSFYQAEMAKAKAMIQQQYPGMYRFRGPTPPGAPSMPGPGPNYMQQMQMMRQQRANSPSEVITLDDQPPPHAGPSMARGRGRGGRGGRRGRPRLDPDTDLDFSPEPSALSQQEMIARLQQSGMQVTSKAQPES